MGEVPSGICQARCHRSGSEFDIFGISVKILVSRFCRKSPGGNRRIAFFGRSVNGHGSHMGVGGQLAWVEGVGRRPCFLAEYHCRETRACGIPLGATWHSAAEVGKSKRRAAIATVSGPKDAEERGVAADGQKLPATEGPASRGKVAREELDLSDEWI